MDNNFRGKIYHFNTYLKGGASIAAQRLFDSLIDNGIQSKFFSTNSTYKQGYERLTFPSEINLVDRVKRKFYARKYYTRLKKYLSGRPVEYELFSSPELLQNTIFPFKDENRSIIHLHWISEWIDYTSFFNSIPDHMPVVWTLHDMNPFTGGCHYSWSCQKFAEECHTCPQLNNNRQERDLSNYNFKIKEEALRNKQIHIVADSYWLEAQARKSRIFRNAKSFQTIHYGLDFEAFSPIEKKFAKKALGFDETDFILCFGADSITNKRKGFQLLTEALKKVESQLPNAKCLVFGADQENIKRELNIPFVFVGTLNSTNIQSLVYSAADIFVIPSIYEAFGQTALEAMSCGTPVIGFRTGGIPDMVENKINGLLANVEDVDDLKEKILELYQNEGERLNMGMNARTKVVAQFNLDRQAEKYIELYQRLIQ
jgi:glycosyltransferase involved in cell wall biosynthesis